MDRTGGTDVIKSQTGELKTGDRGSKTGREERHNPLPIAILKSFFSWSVQGTAGGAATKKNIFENEYSITYRPGRGGPRVRKAGSGEILLFLGKKGFRG
jgi:hypothetical protein